MTENPFSGLVSRIDQRDLRSLLDATLLRLSIITMDPRWVEIRGLSLADASARPESVDPEIILRASADAITAGVAGVFSVGAHEIEGRGRSERVSAARHLAMVIHQDLNRCSGSATARAFDRDHSMMLLARRRTTERAEVDPEFRALIAAARKLLIPDQR